MHCLKMAQKSGMTDVSEKGVTEKHTKETR